MVAYCVAKLTAKYSAMIEQIFDIVSLASSGYNDPLKSISWKVLETASSHLNMRAFMTYMHRKLEHCYSSISLIHYRRIQKVTPPPKIAKYLSVEPLK